MRILPTKVGAGVVAAALVASAVPAQATASPCFNDTDMQSARIHDLRVMLMVNALKCRSLAPATLRSYGRLINQRSDEFMMHGQRVQSSLQDRYGQSQGRSAFRDYETRSANYHSVVTPTQEHCQDVGAFIKLASRASHSELETLSKLATNRKIEACLVPESSFADAPAQEDNWGVTVRRGEVPAQTVAIVEEPEMVDGVPTYTVPGTGLDGPAPEPVETVALVDPVAVSELAPASQDDKLSQAISALDAAAAALRDMQSSDTPSTQ